MVAADGDAGPEGRRRHFLAFTHRVEGDLRFISHHDMMRLFQRAVARAKLPMKWSEGFNPRPKLNLPLPRPVGMASECDLLVLECEAPVEAGEAFRKLAAQMPPGLVLTNVETGTERVSSQPARVRYRFPPDPPPDPDTASRVRHLLEQETLEIERVAHDTGKVRRFDARPHIHTMRVEGEAVEFELDIFPQGTVRPSEVAGLLGYDADAINHRIQRLEVQWR